MANLTAKQEMFCREYLVDLNATQAAIRAGYSVDSANVQGSQNLAKASIQERVAKLMAERTQRVTVSADYVLERAKMIHEACWNQDDAKNSIAALKLVGDHVNVQAFKQHTEISGGITVEPKGLDDFYKQGDE